MSLPFAVLLWLHVFSAVGWLGSGLVFGMLIGPTLPTLTPASRGEVIVKLMPKYLRFLTVFALITPLLGLALAFGMGDGSFSVFTPNSTLGIGLSIGALLTVILWAVLFSYSLPAGRKLVRLTQEAMKNPGPPSPELVKASGRLRIGATFGLIVIILVFTAMIAAASL